MWPTRTTRSCTSSTRWDLWRWAPHGWPRDLVSSWSCRTAGSSRRSAGARRSRSFGSTLRTSVSSTPCPRSRPRSSPSVSPRPPTTRSCSSRAAGGTRSPASTSPRDGACWTGSSRATRALSSRRRTGAKPSCLTPWVRRSVSSTSPTRGTRSSTARSTAGRPRSRGSSSASRRQGASPRFAPSWVCGGW
jgi:hypothetical protein